MTLNAAITAYLAAPARSDAAADAYDAIQQHLAAGYEADGRTGAEIDGMDLAAEADVLIERARRR